MPAPDHVKYTLSSVTPTSLFPSKDCDVIRFRNTHPTISITLFPVGGVLGNGITLAPLADHVLQGQSGLRPSPRYAPSQAVYQAQSVSGAPDIVLICE